jgi:hypothetical protein
MERMMSVRVGKGSSSLVGLLSFHQALERLKVGGSGVVRRQSTLQSLPGGHAGVQGRNPDCGGDWIDSCRMHSERAKMLGVCR